MKHKPTEVTEEPEENVSTGWVDLWAPKCPVNIGDRFIKNYKNDFNLIYWQVQEIKEMEDDLGKYWAITAKAPNLAVGQNVKTFSSRFLDKGDYTILKKGVDF